MSNHSVGILGSLCIGLLVLAGPALSQEVEIHPYAGGVFPAAFGEDGGDFKDEGIYGVRGGVFVTDRILVEGNLGWVNHFEFEGTDPRSSALLWDANTSYHFFPEETGRVSPFVTFGLGGVTAFLDEDEEPVRLLLQQGATRRLGRQESAGPGLRVHVLDDQDTFLSINYGGGIKATRLWGPLGLRFDVRGRTLPNIFGGSGTWLETAGGLTFNWGER